MNPSGSGGRRAVLLLDEGEDDGNFFHWAEDEEHGTEGFLDALGGVFWTWGDHDYSWYQRRFQGRRTRKGKGKRRQDLEPKEKEKEEKRKNAPCRR